MPCLLTSPPATGCCGRRGEAVAARAKLRELGGVVRKLSVAEIKLLILVFYSTICAGGKEFLASSLEAHMKSNPLGLDRSLDDYVGRSACRGEPTAFM